MSKAALAALALFLAGPSPAPPMAEVRLTPDEARSTSFGDATTGSSLVAGIRTKVLLGNPAASERYSILLFVPAHTTIAAHSHRDDRMASVVSGEWRIGYGSTFDESALKSCSRLPETPCATRTLNVHGFHGQADKFGPLSVYGSDALLIQDLARAEPSLAAALHPALPICGAEVVWAARFEMARTVEDVLARRTRALFLNARAAIAMAPRVAELMAGELGRDSAWQSAQVEAFTALARGYLVRGVE